jgi:hypothetical protein
MHTVIRTYDTQDVLDTIVENSEEIEDLLGSIDGFVSFQAIRTPLGTVTVTTCNNRAGCEESNKRARDWLSQNTDIKATPTIAEGPVDVDF